MLLFHNESFELQWVIKWEQPGFEHSIGSASKKQRIMSLPLTSSAAMEYIAEEGVVVEDDYGSHTELGSVAKGAFEVLKRAMKSVSLVYGFSFQRLLEAAEQSSEDIFNGLQVVICNLPNNTCRISELSNSEHYRLGPQYILTSWSCSRH